MPAIDYYWAKPGQTPAPAPTSIRLSDGTLRTDPIQKPRTCVMQNKGLKELAGGGIGSAVGVLVVVLTDQFGSVTWNGTNATLLVLALQGMWSFVRPYVPKPKGENDA